MKLCQPLMILCSQTCFGMFERQLLEGLHLCGVHLREALRGAHSLRFTVSPAAISFWEWVVVGCFCVCVCLFCFACVFFVCVGLLPALRSNCCYRNGRTVGAVMARTAWEKKKSSLSVGCNKPQAG